MTLILGINAFHADSSACIVKDGVLIGAVEEERFNRCKHWAGFPSQSIHWCLEEAGQTVEDLDHIAINTRPSAHILRRIAYTMATRPNISFLGKRLKNKRERNNLQKILSELFQDNVIRAKLHFVEHHLGHMCSAFYPSPFHEASVVSIDGFGDFASGAWGFGTGCNIKTDGHIFFPHSLGAFYTAITQYLGFPNYGDEYKVMGLAPYGKPSYLNKMKQVVRMEEKGQYKLDLRYFQHSGKKDLEHQWSNGSPKVGQHWSNDLIDLLGPARSPEDTIEERHLDIAHSAQKMYELAFFNLLDYVYKLHQSPYLCIAGGCGANSVANGKIHINTRFEKVYVQAAAGDAGGAMGAALEVWHRLGNRRCDPMTNAYLGCKFSENDVQNLISSEETKEALRSEKCTIHNLNDDLICSKVVDALTNGRVVGWFEGKMEWGPRALGHRSILGDPRRSDMKDILNQKIKRRESFRPFAPSILREHVEDWFETDGDVPFMMQVYSIREQKRKEIPAVTHVDGSGRLQTVTESDNGRYYKLIKRFYEETGIPIILNTSFNENEPIVCTPKEALDCFLRTKMDVLVMENILIDRNQ